MLWLQSPPWGRWLAATLILCVALVIELRPDHMLDHPFAVETIRVGEPVTDLNTEMRRVPAGLFDPPDPGSVASREILAGAPVMAGDTGQAGRIVPSGWWTVEMDVPGIAAVGDQVQIVLLDSGKVVPGVVAVPSSDDPFHQSAGGVAVDPAAATEVALAASAGRVTVLVPSG